MPPIVSIIGRSQSGKTTLIEKLTAEFKARGRRVAVIKHAEDFELDRENKDSWRFSRAGADVVAISSMEKVAFIRRVDRDLSPQEITGWLGSDCDLVLTEGFKRSETPKIEVHRKDRGEGLLSPPGRLLAVVTDEVLDVKAPQFSGNDVAALADLIDEYVQVWNRGESFELLVNGSELALSPHLKDLFSRTLVGMVLGLRGVDGVGSLRISLRRQA